MDQGAIEKFMQKYGGYDTDVLRAISKRYVGEELEAINQILAKRGVETHSQTEPIGDRDTGTLEAAGNGGEGEIPSAPVPRSSVTAGLSGTAAVTRRYKDAYRTATGDR